MYTVYYIIRATDSIYNKGTDTYIINKFTNSHKTNSHNTKTHTPLQAITHLCPLSELIFILYFYK